MLAKLVSGLHKPDDQTVLLPPDVLEFVAPLPVRALPGEASVKTQIDRGMLVTERPMTKASLSLPQLITIVCMYCYRFTEQGLACCNYHQALSWS